MSTNSRFVSLMVSIPVVAGLLIGMCSAVAPAAELEGCHAYEAECSEQPLANGRPGETVRVCARVALVCSAPVRRVAGTTVLYHARNGHLIAAR